MTAKVIDLSMYRKGRIITNPCTPPFNWEKELELILLEIQRQIDRELEQSLLEGSSQNSSVSPSNLFADPHMTILAYNQSDVQLTKKLEELREGNPIKP